MHEVQSRRFQLAPDLEQDCQEIIREGSKSFHLASLALPAEVRTAARALYAFCRVADDIVDDPACKRQSLEQLRRRIDHAYAGDPFPHAADRAFAEVVRHYGIPATVPLAMIEGFEWDLDNRAYETIDDVLAYATRVAGTVGVMMTLVMNRRRSRTLARACELGMAMQLTNIARDVGEDARNGRLYLPRQWMREEGIHPDDFLHRPRFSAPLGRVVARLLKVADRLYARSITGVADLPASCRPGVLAAARAYAEIGRKVRANGYNSVDQRAVSSRNRKLFLVAVSLGGMVPLRRCDPALPLPAANFLVQSVVSSEGGPQTAAGWFMDLLMQLDHRERVPHFPKPTFAQNVSSAKV